MSGAPINQPNLDKCQTLVRSARLMIVAGEASGEKHGAALIRALTRINPGMKLEIFGSGGEEMRAAGAETLVDARDVAIIGLPEITLALRRLYRAYRTLLAAARARRPDAVVLIDWPDFNLRLARRLHHEGFKVVYYISPQVWAWRRWRVRAIRRSVDRMLVILPFEEKFYKDAGVEVEYVGHPLAGVVNITASRLEFAQRHGLDPERQIIALLPGSRHKEIHYHLPALLDAARLLESKMPSLQFVVPLASTIGRHQVEAIIDRSGTNAVIIERDTYNAIGHAEFAIVASGTATVEAALLGTPMVIIYRASEINWRLIRPFIHLDTFGMVNLIAGRRIVPELIQHAVTGEKIAQAVEALLSSPTRLNQMREELKRVRDLLSTGGSQASERAARSIMQMISGRERCSDA
jgi:lipid-A-disaccharide synthase